MPSSGDLPDPGIEPGSPASQAGSLPTELPGKPCNTLMLSNKCNFYYTSHKNIIVHFIMLHSTLLKMTLLNQDKFHSFLKPTTLSKFWIAVSQQGQLQKLPKCPQRSLGPN